MPSAVRTAIATLRSLVAHKGLHRLFVPYQQKNPSEFSLGLPQASEAWLHGSTLGITLQTMHQTSTIPPTDASSAHAMTGAAEPTRPIGRAWIVVGVVALLAGLVMGLIMSSVSS